MQKCECPNPGYCPFHKMEKPQHLWRLCQTNEKYRELWDKQQQPQNTTTDKPGLLQQAINLGASIVRHVANGFQSASEDEKQKRLAICKECPSCELLEDEPHKCNKCGCYLQIKAGWKNERCPDNKWPGDTIPPDAMGGCNCH